MDEVWEEAAEEGVEIKISGKTKISLNISSQKYKISPRPRLDSL